MGVTTVLHTSDSKDEYYCKCVNFKYPEHICGTVKTNETLKCDFYFNETYFVGA